MPTEKKKKGSDIMSLVRTHILINNWKPEIQIQRENTNEDFFCIDESYSQTN